MFDDIIQQAYDLAFGQMIAELFTVGGENRLETRAMLGTAADFHEELRSL